jgi:hypothetical protein
MHPTARKSWGMSAMVTANKVRKCGETSMHETINIVAGNARWDWATRGALLGIALVTLASCASSSSLKLSAQDHDSFMAINDNLIVPNQRIGPAFLGMTVLLSERRCQYSKVQWYGNSGYRFEPCVPYQ